MTESLIARFQQQLKTQFKSKQFLAFIVAGGIAAMVNFTSRIIYNQWVDFSTAVIIAYLTGMITAFILTRVFVFTNSQQKLHRSIIYFCLVNLLAVAQTWGISIALAYHLLPQMGVTHFVNEISHAVGVAIPIFTSYLGHKYFSFKATA